MRGPPCPGKASLERRRKGRETSRPFFLGYHTAPRVRQRRAADGCLKLACFGYPQRAFGPVDVDPERPRQRLQRHGGSGAVASRILSGNADIELRLKVFNLFNTFNGGQPNNNFASGTFGRITTLTGDPRIMQFGIKYGF